MNHDLLNPSALRTEGGFNAALVNFQTLVQRRNTRLDRLVEEVCGLNGFMPRLIARTYCKHMDCLCLLGSYLQK